MIQSASSIHPAVYHPANSQSVVPEHLCLKAAGTALPPIIVRGVQCLISLTLCRAHLISGGHHDLLVESFECPAVLDEIICEIIQKSWVGRLASLKAKVVYGFYDASSKMMIPEPVHNDPRKKVPSPMIYVGDPFRYSASLHRSPGSGRPFYGPVVGSFMVPGENLEKVDWGYPIFLGRISADQIVTFLIEIRHFSTIGVMSHRLQTFRAYHHLFLFTYGPS